MLEHASKHGIFQGIGAGPNHEIFWEHGTIKFFFFLLPRPLGSSQKSQKRAIKFPLSERLLDVDSLPHAAVDRAWIWTCRWLPSYALRLEQWQPRNHHHTHLSHLCSIPQWAGWAAPSRCELLWKTFMKMHTRATLDRFAHSQAFSIAFFYNSPTQAPSCDDLRVGVTCTQQHSLHTHLTPRPMWPHVKDVKKPRM